MQRESHLHLVDDVVGAEHVEALFGMLLCVFRRPVRLASTGQSAQHDDLTVLLVRRRLRATYTLLWLDAVHERVALLRCEPRLLLKIK